MECTQILPKTDKFFTHRFQFLYTPTVFGYIVEMAALSHPPQKQLKIKIHNKILQPKYMYTTLNRTGIHINNPQNLTLQQRNISWYKIQNHFNIMRFHITNTKNFQKFDSLIHTKEILFRILTDLLSNIGVNLFSLILKHLMQCGKTVYNDFT